MFQKSTGKVAADHEASLSFSGLLSLRCFKGIKGKWYVSMEGDPAFMMKLLMRLTCSTAESISKVN